MSMLMSTVFTSGSEIGVDHRIPEWRFTLGGNIYHWGILLSGARVITVEATTGVINNSRSYSPYEQYDRGSVHTKIEIELILPTYLIHDNEYPGVLNDSRDGLVEELMELCVKLQTKNEELRRLESGT